MKNTYTKPQICYICISDNDVVRTSNTIVEGSDNIGQWPWSIDDEIQNKE